MCLPLNPYEEIALTGMPPGKSKYECQLCEKTIEADDVFLWRTVICCEECYLEMTGDEL